MITSIVVIVLGSATPVYPVCLDYGCNRVEYRAGPAPACCDSPPYHDILGYYPKEERP